MLLFPFAFPLWLAAIIGVSLLAATRDFAALMTNFWNDPPKRSIEYYVVDRLHNVVPLRKTNRVIIKRGMGARFLQR